MAIVALEGFDHYASNADVRGRFVGSRAVLGPGRTGGQALYAEQEFVTFADITYSTTAPQLDFAASGNVTFGCGFLSSVRNGDPDPAGVALRRNGVVQIWVRFNPLSRRIEVYDFQNAAILGTSDFRWFPNRWYFLEAQVVGGASGSFEVRVNNVTILAAGGVNTNSSDGKFDQIVWGVDGSGGNCAVDDLYILDNEKAGAQGFLGDLVVTSLSPDADRTVTWDAAPNTNDNFANVDDTAVLNDADFNESGVVGDQDVYELEQLPTNPSVIAGIEVLARARKDLAGTREIKVGGAASNNAQDIGSAQALSTEWVYHSHLLENSPAGVVWTASRVNGAAIVVEVA